MPIEKKDIQVEMAHEAITAVSSAPFNGQVRDGLYITKQPIVEVRRNGRVTVEEMGVILSATAQKEVAVEMVGGDPRVEQVVLERHPILNGGAVVVSIDRADGDRFRGEITPGSFDAFSPRDKIAVRNVLLMAPRVIRRGR